MLRYFGFWVQPSALASAMDTGTLIVSPVAASTAEAVTSRPSPLPLMDHEMVPRSSPDLFARAIANRALVVGRPLIGAISWNTSMGFSPSWAAYIRATMHASGLPWYAAGTMPLWLKALATRQVCSNAPESWRKARSALLDWVESAEDVMGWKGVGWSCQCGAQSSHHPGKLIGSAMRDPSGPGQTPVARHWARASIARSMRRAPAARASAAIG